MPNFKLGDHYQRIIKDNINHTLGNYVKGFINNFPLTHDEVQACIMPHDLLAQCETLWAAGVHTLARSTGVKCLLDRDMTGTGTLKRHCVLLLHSTKDNGFFTAGDAQPYVYGSVFSGRNSDRERAKLISIDLRGLDADRAQAVIDWCHRLIRADRLRDMVQTTVSRALVNCTSTAHLVANWPELASFAKEDGTLRKRLASAPTKLDRYKVGEGYLPPKKQRDAANVVLAMGAMALPAAKNTDEAEVQGNIHEYEKLPTDPVF